MAHRGSSTRGMAILCQGGVDVKEQEIRVVGIDCAEDEHVAVLLGKDGEFESRLSVVNRSRNDLMGESWPMPRLSLDVRYGKSTQWL